MTRFMMTIEDAVNLAVYAFQHAAPGDTIVKKSSAATIETVALALRKLLRADNPIRVIGTRHGEKLHETLLTREELAVAEDLGGHYRVPADGRSLNYSLYFSEGREDVSTQVDYNSHNTERLDLDGMCCLLEQLEPVQRAMQGIRIEL